MANSFTVGGLELIGTTTNPEYRLGRGMDGGTITPETATLSSLSTDGEWVSGKRTGNKAWSFTVLVSGADRPTLSRNVDTLLAAVAADSIKTLPVVWTPSGCPSTNFTAFRATATAQKDMGKADQGYAEVLIQFATAPFGESSTAQVITVPATGGPATLQVDGMNSGTFTAATLDTTTRYEGAGSAAVTLSKNAAGQYVTSAAAGRTVTSVDLSSYAGGAFGFRVRTLQVAPVIGPDMGGLICLLTFRAAGGTAYSTTVIGTDQAGNWKLASFPGGAFTLTGFFDWTAVTSWDVAFVTFARQITPSDPSTTKVWIDDLRAYPPGSVSNSTAEGGVLMIPGVLGSARTPVAVQVKRAAVGQSSGNVLTAVDSSLETGVGSWTATNATLTSSTALALQATHSLQMTTTGGVMTVRTAASGAMAVVTPNTAYTLTASLRAAAGSTSTIFVATVQWFDAAGAPISSVSGSNALTNASGWATSSANVTSPSNAAYANIVVASASSLTTSQNYYLDAVGLIVGTSQPWVIGTGTYAAIGSALPITNCLLHFPPGDQDCDATILAGLAAGTVTIPAANMSYDDTFSVAVLFSASAGAGASRVITVAIAQKLGAITVASQSISATVVGVQTIASISQSGQQVTLPLLDVPAENSNSSLVITVSSTNGTDTFSDVALCSTSGQTILVTGLPSTNTALYVDKPDPTVGLGPVYASATDRTQATSALPNLAAYVGPPQLEPGNNRVLVASTNGAPGLIATLNDRWLDEAQE